MSNQHDVDEKEKRQKLKASGDPYAWHYYFDEAEEKNPVASRNSELFASQNPYATLHHAAEPPKQDGGSLIQKLSCSKADFRSECREIFIHYIPKVENGRLRKHHLAFINRNIDRSGEERALILGELRKYDLRAEGPLVVHFNREREDLTESKLMEIENRALAALGK